MMMEFTWAIIDGVLIVLTKWTNDRKFPRNEVIITR